MKLVIGNWKLNLSSREGLDVLDSCLKELLRNAGNSHNQGFVGIAPPFTALSALADYSKKYESRIKIGAQHCFWEASGAYTGEISAGLLAKEGASFCLVGHSERRTLFGETSENIVKRIGACLSASLLPIYCIGETLDQRNQGQTQEVLETQLTNELLKCKDMMTGNLVPVIAYEPVWAIGTGLSANQDDISRAHSAIKSWLSAHQLPAIKILYGGSVAPATAEEIVSNPLVDGVLVGGASIKADSFLKIIKACHHVN